MAAPAQAGQEAAPAHKHPYHLVDPSPWPLIGSFAGGALVLGIILNAHYGTRWLLILGVLGVLFTMAGWWRDVIKESQTPGLHTPVVRLGLRYGMMLFIASEVMFFVAFFWAYFHFALYPEHVSGATTPTWPPQGIKTFDPLHLPLLNTLILLLSGCTVTWAHHGILHGDKRTAVSGLALTVLLGILFTAIQAYEYASAPFPFAGGGIYSSTFFLATGFHGFHVIVGTLFLLVCLVRAAAGHFTPEKHFGFEAAAWYWHFVDVVWLFLFVSIYVFGAGEIAHH
ncbi:MAG: cytochrome c oxidase subunit 3 [Rhodovarius sp.]|nr:cytochrome c oxidase subunit 3 [Rhodovarius sp.]